MAKCKYCKKPAWFLKWKHKKCDFIHKLNKHKISSIIANSFFNKTNIEKLKPEILSLAKEWYISNEELNTIYLYNYDSTIKKFLYDGIITPQEEKKIIQFRDTFNLDQDLLDKHGFADKFLKSIIVRDLAETKKSSVLFDTDMELPFDLEKDEDIIRIFDDIDLYKKKGEIVSKVDEELETQENSFFDSIFSKNLIKEQKTKFLDSGTLLITNKNTYILWDIKTFKIGMKKILELLPYKDGLWFQTKEEKIPFDFLGNLDWWFAYNILFNLSR